ncbi:hypothetical protein H4S02_007177 [Coemansia sp. RSA 2611]|nr:hypothetical protein H4S02_007177 [Coemansia sp. RSA 2611]
MARVTAVGWGMTSATGGFGSVPNSLQETELVVGSQKECREFVPGYESSDGPQICTQNKLLLGKDTCQGDSGTGVFITVAGSSYFRSFIDSVASPSNKLAAEDDGAQNVDEVDDEEDEGEEENNVGDEEEGD